MHQLRIPSLAALFILAASLLSGCGRDGSNPIATAPTSPLQAPPVIVESGGDALVEDAAEISQTGATVQARDNRYSARFGLDGGRIAIPSSLVLRPPAFTVEMWVRPEVLAKYTPLITQPTNEWNTASGIGLKFESGGVYLRVAIASNLGVGHFAPFVPQRNRWVHVAGTYNGTLARVYLDGELVLEVLETRPVYYGNVGYLLGAGYHSRFGGPGWFKGLMDEVRLWNYARSGDEIRKAMRHEFDGPEFGLIGYWNFERDALGQDLSGNALHGIVDGDVGRSGNTPF